MASTILDDRLLRIAQAAALAALAIAGLALLGWILDYPALVRLGAGGAMAPNASIGLLAVAVALQLRLRGGPVASRAVPVLAVAALALGGLTLLQDIASVEFGIDQSLFTDVRRLVRTSHPGRMAPLTALALSLSALSLLLVGSPVDRRSGVASWLGIPIMLLALFALFGLGYDAARLAASSGSRGVALPTVATLVCIAVAILCARPGTGPASILRAPGEGGLLSRRLLPVALLAPPLLGWFLLEGMNADLYGKEGFAALTAMLTLLLFVGLGGGLAHALERRDGESRRFTEALRHDQDLLNRAQEISHIGGWEIDIASGRIAWTPEVFRIHEVAPDHDPNDLDRNLHFYAPGDRERLGAAVAAACRDGTPWDLESAFVTATGKARWVRTSGRADWRDGKVWRVCGFIVDITDLRNAQRTAQDLQATLERRVAERTRALDDANHELEAFAYSVSHDLRAPLRAVDGFARILEEDYAARLDDDGKDALARVRGGAQKMGHLIDDMLKLSRLSRSEMKAEAVDLAELARSVATSLQAADPARKASFVIAASATAFCDRGLLAIVLENLLGNAWKFTGKHASARIEFGTGEHDGQPAFYVRDDGAGFDMAHVKNLFVPFQRLHGTGEFPGTGIGLATVRRIIQRHGGTVWAEGGVEAGATFHFTLPRAPANANEGERP